MSPHTPEGGDSQNTQKIPSVVLDVQKSEPCSLLVGMSNGVIAMENSMKDTQKIKNKQTNTEPSSGPTSALLGLHQKDVKARARKDICTPVLIAALLTKAKRWKQHKCPSIDEWRNNMWHIHTADYSQKQKVACWLPGLVGAGWGEGRLLFSGYRVSHLQDERILEVCFKIIWIYST